MNPLLAGVALAVVAGAVVAVSMRDPRVVILGLAATLLASPLLAEPVAEPLGLAARLVGSILAAYLLWIAVRERTGIGPVAPATGGSRIGWPAEVLVAASAAIVGFAAHGLGAPAGGPALASAAGFAVAALAVAPLLTGRDILRVGTGMFLLFDAALVVRIGLAGAPGRLEQLVTAVLFITLGGALAALAMAARTDGAGGLELAAEVAGRRVREPDAHPIDPDAVS